MLCGHSNRFSLPRLTPWHVRFLSGEKQTVRSHHEIFISPRPSHCSHAWQFDRITSSLNLATLAAKFGSFHRQPSQTGKFALDDDYRNWRNLLTNHQVVWVRSTFAARNSLQNSIFTSVLRLGSEFSTLAQNSPENWDEETFSAISLTSQHLRICKKEGRLGSLSCFRAARTLNNPELSTYSISLFFSRTFSKIIPRTAVNLDGLGRGIYRALVQLHPCVLDVRVGRIVHFNCVLIYIPCREDVFHVLVVQDPAAVYERPHWPKSHQHSNPFCVLVSERFLPQLSLMQLNCTEHAQRVNFTPSPKRLHLTHNSQRST